MQHDDLPLLRWRPPIQIIPFPSANRVGHALRLAQQLSKARTNREADYVLSRAVKAHCRQMRNAGLPPCEIERERVEYLGLIETQCRRINARWVPEISHESSEFEPGGAA